MRFGCLCAIADMSELADVGFDFAETDISALYPALGDADFRRARHRLLAEALFAEVIRVPDLVTHANERIAGKASSPVGNGALELQALFRRAALVGCKTIVTTTPGYNYIHRFNGEAEAWKEAMDAVGLLGEHASRTGVSIALRPNGHAGGLAATIEEAWVLSAEVGHPAVGVAADITLIADWADMAAAGAALKHVHVPLPRRFGGGFDTTMVYEAIAALVEFGYQGRVSIAAPWAAFSDRAVDLLDELKSLAQDS